MSKHKFPYEWNLSDGYPAKGIDYHGSKVFSCFACGGGSTMGYKLAGYEVLGMNEIDPKMAKAYIANHNPKYSFIEDIREFKVRKDIPKELYDLDILDGSPPCSSFSMAGNREKDWGKNKKFKEGQAKQVLDTLFFDFIDLAKELQPKVVVAENVKGLLQGNAKKYVREIYKQFDAAGYYCQHWLLNASKMGVPQKRERVFFICLRKDLAKQFLYQKDMFTKVPKLELEFNEKGIVFGGIINKGYRKPIQESIIDADIFCNRNKVADFAKYFEEKEGKRKYFNTRLIFKNRVCDTIKGDCRHVIEGESSFINDEELKRVGTYPIDYNFGINKVSYLIGMSVPPVMMAQISHNIYKQWISKL